MHYRCENRRQYPESKERSETYSKESSFLGRVVDLSYTENAEYVAR